MPGQQTFDPNEFFVTVAGVPLTQFMKGSFVTVTYDSDAFVDDAGAQGDVVRVNNPDRRATLKCSLQAASPSNDYLSTFLNTDRLTNEATFPVQIKDARGTTVQGTAQAWIKKAPDQAFSNTEVVGRDWEIRCARMEGNVGGTLPL